MKEKEVAKGSEIIGQKKLLDSQFEEEVTCKIGYKLEIRKEWK
nr:hypothetical protein [Candidatus Brachybacter algidus]